MKILWMAILCMLSSRVALAEEEIRGIVTKIIDGNTIEVTTFTQEVYTMMLLGIDSPEPGQNYAEQAKRMLARLLLDQNVKVAIHGKDRKGNRLGIIEMPNGVDPRHELLKAGLAWTSERDPFPDLETLRVEASSKKVGLWQDNEPIPPWQYRRQQSMAQPKVSG